MLGVVALAVVAIPMDQSAASTLSAAKTNAATESVSDLPRQTAESIIAQLDKCGANVPNNFNVKTDCMPLSPGGSGSRSLVKMLEDDGVMRASHEHSLRIDNFVGTSNPPSCYLLPLREPAMRIESWFHSDQHAGNTVDLSKVVGDKTIDAWFEKSILGGGGRQGNLFAECSARSIPLVSFISNYTGIKDKPVPDQIINSMAQRSIENGIDGVDTSKIKMDFGDVPAQPTVDAPIVDCVANNLMIRFFCLDDLYGRYQTFMAAAEKGEALPVPTESHLDENPTVNASKYATPGYMLSAENRAIVNDVFFAHDMAIFRHFCLGEENQVASALSSPTPLTYNQGKQRHLDRQKARSGDGGDGVDDGADSDDDANDETERENDELE